MVHTNTLDFLRNATEKKDGKEGIMYLHTWYVDGKKAGHQCLIFESKMRAENFLKTLNAKH